MECSSIHDDSDVFSTALHQLKVLASQNNFTVHNVPYDGNCMFSAASYQLQTTGVCCVDSSELRQKVADHLEANAALYCDFLSQPVSSDDSYNADTEQPTAEDEVADHLEANAALYCDFLSQPVSSDDSYNADTEQPTAEDEHINSVADPQLQTELRWSKYLRCLRQGAWGDHITMQGIADMLCVKINVLSSHHPMLSVTPGTGSAECEIFVGLIMQYHYVGLDTIGSNVEQNAQPNNSSSDDTENAQVADETCHNRGGI